ncbi:MAG: FGGY family carbohydrate kinase [Bacteroidota bacterium]|nr:FGGY family carbohydrate kinase [Bacteroidota bacterium]MDP4249544.1 FGGY family carbohydrate kinase [Bacteroidota bacterium]
MKYFLGYDIGSSSVKVALLEAESGKPLAAAFSPASEMDIQAPRPGFAEQDPELWWQELIRATRELRKKHPFSKDDIGAIGISYQMHGLVCVDKDLRPLRPAIIWCDSRAVTYGNQAFEQLGHSYCLEHFLNSPGNFTASKLKWVKENEPEIYKKIYRILLPGDFIALKLTGEAVTTVSGLSEGIFWDYKENNIAKSLLDFYGIDTGLLAPTVPTFGEQGELNTAAGELLDIAAGTPVCYRAGDQPNNAFSLHVLEPGEIAATAGTSGVVYGVTDRASYDPLSRVNPFVHVNHLPGSPRYGILMCLNGTGILNSWLKKNFFGKESYADMNAAAELAAPGADGIYCYPFGNGAERILENKNPGAEIRGIDFNRHSRNHVARAAQEGIVFSLIYGTEIMQPMGLQLSRVRAGFANMFLSNLFARSFANLSGCTVELYNTDGALGAARGAGFGVKYYPGYKDCFKGMEIVQRVDPQVKESERIREVYQQWKEGLIKLIK